MEEYTGVFENFKQKINDFLNNDFRNIDVTNKRYRNFNNCIKSIKTNIRNIYSTINEYVYNTELFNTYRNILYNITKHA